MKTRDKGYRFLLSPLTAFGPSLRYGDNSNRPRLSQLPCNVSLYLGNIMLYYIMLYHALVYYAVAAIVIIVEVELWKP